MRCSRRGGQFDSDAVEAAARRDKALGEAEPDGHRAVIHELTEVIRRHRLLDEPDIVEERRPADARGRHSETDLQGLSARFGSIRRPGEADGLVVHVDRRQIKGSR